MRNVFIELTNPVHGGTGWEFGTCLWSPTKSKRGVDSWRTMRKPKSGDIIIHSYKTISKPQTIQGLSVVAEKYYITDVEPENPDVWSRYGSYYRIDLKNYTEVPEKKKLQEFLNVYNKEIQEYHSDKDITGTFYNKEIRVAQKYLEKVDFEIFNLLLKFLKISNVDDFLGIDGSVTTDATEFNNYEETTSTRKNYIISRKVRDTRVMQELKKKYENRCQICGNMVRIGEDKFYSEGAYIKPLDSPHDGSDTKENIIILCPNHHVEFDYGMITINHKTKLINHVDASNKINGQSLSYDRADIDEEFLKYHNKKIYKGA